MTRYQELIEVAAWYFHLTGSCIVGNPAGYQPPITSQSLQQHFDIFLSISICLFNGSVVQSDSS